MANNRETWAGAHGLQQIIDDGGNVTSYRNRVGLIEWKDFTPPMR